MSQSENQSDEGAQESSRKIDENLKWFLFENKIRDIVRDTVSPLFVKDEHTCQRIDDLSASILDIKSKLDNLFKQTDDHASQLRRSDLLYVRVDEIERKFTKYFEELKIEVNSLSNNVHNEKQKLSKFDSDHKMLDNKINSLVGNVNHSRETFLDLKGQLYREVSGMKENFQIEMQELADELRQTKTSQET